jgi:uncharacterized protein
MPVTEFTPLASLLGGAMIGLSAALLMLFEGRIAGIAGIASRLIPPWRESPACPVAFLTGLLLAPVLYALWSGGFPAQTVSSNLWLMGIAGALVGFGTVLGSGCTSGHGVCGLARLSPRSLAAVVMFMAVAGITVFVTRHGMGG